jgi:hypothetical protein
MNKIIKIVFILIFILFLALYLSRYDSYYENQNVLTNEAIEKFEDDIKNGKEIIASNYLQEEKNYNNKVAKMGLKTSNLIEKGVSKILKIITKALAQIDEN